MATEFYSGELNALSKDRLIKAIKLRSLLAGVDIEEGRIVDLILEWQDDLSALQELFQIHYGIALEELLLSSFGPPGRDHPRVLAVFHSKSIALRTHSLYLGLAGKFSPEALVSFLRHDLAGGFDQTAQRFRTFGTFTAVARLYERWYGAHLHPENPSLSYAVWYQLERHTLLHSAMSVVDTCLAYGGRPKRV